MSLALIAVILLRCVTETPLTFGTILNGDFLTHLLLFMICLRGFRKEHKSPSTAPFPVFTKSSNTVILQ